ncbi:cyclic GMP-AMP synthase DncV-like nucleotidyltransferase [Deinococcus kurensis]|uniref:cyclic GMP-AMP synthase DncV-like nucleotidyltransferase n=1 Tax=Deinococcus kurensis TaxID=2662757 RepID=UPI0012D34B02|nr:nucleotidyltransferase [Deinococcus kurensis]
MANVQTHFITFHTRIKLVQVEENQVLRDARDAVLDALRAGLRKLFKEKGTPVPTFTPFNQGSYAMNTGVKPVLGREYDIDVGLDFDLITDDHDPVEVKIWIRDALKVEGITAEIRRSCVTVFRDGYHVDLAVYARPRYGTALHLAKGKENSGAAHRLWQVSDPQGLKEKIAGQFSGEDGQQFRRTIRSLKRWRDENFSADGNAAPIGIGLTVAAYHWFQVQKTTSWMDNKVTYDDRLALEQFVRTLTQNFTQVWDHDEQRRYPRLAVTLPVQPSSDLFEKMTNKQMDAFKQKLDALLTALKQARQELDVHDACAILNAQFGDAFPVPDKQESSKATRAGISGSGSSGC